MVSPKPELFLLPLDTFFIVIFGVEFSSFDVFDTFTGVCSCGGELWTTVDCLILGLCEPFTVVKVSWFDLEV